MSASLETPKPPTPSPRKPSKSQERPVLTYNKALKSLGYGKALENDENGRTKEELDDFLAALDSHLTVYLAKDQPKRSKRFGWKTHQTEWTQMTNYFLVRDGYGQVFWPDTEKTKYYIARLQWSNHQRQITRDLKDLFYWTLKNHRQTARKNAHVRRPGDNAGDPIEFDDGSDEDSGSEGSDTESVFGNRAPGMPSRPSGQSSPREPEPTRPSSGGLFSDFNRVGSEQEVNLPPSDPYAGPFSPNETPSEHVNKGKRRAQMSEAEKIWHSKRAKNENRSLSREHENTNAPVEGSRSESSWAGDKPGLPSSRVRRRASSPSVEPPENAPSPSTYFEAVVDDINREHDEENPRDFLKYTASNWRESTSETIGRPPLQRAPMAPMGTFNTPDLSHEAIAFQAYQSMGNYRNDESPTNDRFAQPERTVQPETTPVAESPRTPLYTWVNRRPPPPAFDHPGPVRSSEPRQPSESTRASEPRSERHEAEQRPRPNVLPNINLKISVRISRKICKLWNMKGTFLQRSLQELVDDLPYKIPLKGLTFVLETPDVTFDDEVTLGDEEAFSAIKTRFQRKIQNYFNSHERREAAAGSYFEIIIARLGWEDSESDDEEKPIF